MNSTNTQHALLILKLNDKRLTEMALLLRAMKRQCYQYPNTIWHVIVVLPHIISYVHDAPDQYQADWEAAIKQRNQICFLLQLPYERIHFANNSAANIIRYYKKIYPGLILPLNRSLLKRSRIMARWHWRKIQNYFGFGYPSSITLAPEKEKKDFSFQSAWFVF